MRWRWSRGQALPRTVRVAATVVGAVVAAVVLLVGVTVTVARTSWGAERLRRLALPRVNAALAGELQVRHFRFWGDRVVLEGVRLNDPEGALVARVERVDVAFSPWALLRRRLYLRAVSVDEPVVLLRQGPTGESNLARALAPRNPSPAAPAPADQNRAGRDGSSRLAIDLAALAIRNATFDLRDQRADTAPALRHVRLVAVAVDGSGRYGDADGGMALRLRVKGDTEAPVRAPLALTVDGQGRTLAAPAGAGEQPAALNLDGTAGIDFALGDSSIQLSGEVQSSASASQRAGAPAAEARRNPGIGARVKLERARVTPELVAALAPGAGSKLKAAVTISGDATLDGPTGKLAASVDVAAAGAAVAIKASVDLARRAIDGLTIRARDIDLGRLMVDGSPSDLSFALDAHAEGHDLATLRGAATFKMPPGRLGGYAIGPIRLRADADRGRYKVMDLLAVIPGVNVTGAGEATAQRVAFRGAVDLRDLGATVRSLTAGSRAGTPRASGRGRVDLTLAGDPRAPGLNVKGHLVDLGWQDIRVPILDVEAAVPDVRVPVAASLTLSVPRADVGTRRFRGLALTLRATGPRFDGHLALTAPEALRLDVAGVWGPAHEELGFQSVTLRSRQATWRSTRPMRVVFTNDVVRVSDLDWRTEDGQRLRLDLDKHRSSTRGDVVVTALDLAKLPESLLPPTLKLAGRLDGEVHVRGRLDRPTVDAKVTLAQGRVGNVRDIALSTDVRLNGRRLSGTLDAGALGARVSGDFDLPVVWPPPQAASLQANITATNIDLQRVLAALNSARDQVTNGSVTKVVAKPPLDVRGAGSGRLRLSGTGASPHVAVEADVRQLKVDGTTAGDVRIELNAPGDRPVTARVEVRQVTVGPGAERPRAASEAPASSGRKATGGGADVTAANNTAAAEKPTAGQSVVTVQTGFSLGALLHHPPDSAQALVSRPLKVEARVDAVKLGPLAALAGYPSKVGGTVSLSANLNGTPQSVQGKVAVTVTGVSAGRFPPTDGVAQFDLGQRDVRADARITRRGATLFAMNARVAAPAARLGDPRLAELLADVPVELHAVLGTLDLQRVGLPPETDREPARILKGRLRAQADVTGTLRAPRANLRVDATELRLDQTPIGSAVALATYADRKATGDVTLVSANGGRLHLVASTKADLGYPAIRRGLDPEQLPVTARLDAKGFDLAGLSGATPGLRIVAGQLFAAVDVTGTAADPRPSGQLEWKEGGLTITGMGEYKRIHFLAHGDQDHVVLDELRADSGGGQARVTGSGDHRPGNGYGIKAAMVLREFPAYVEGQALAALSLEAKADTQVSVRRVRARVSIDSARLALSDAKRKHLQKLAPPADVVLIDGSNPINAAQARKLAAVTAALAPPEQKERASAAAAAAAGQGSTSKPAGVIITVDAPRNLWVSGKDANVELGLQPGFRVEIADATRIFGQVIIKRGRVDVVGRRFDLKADSTARFTGPAELPELDVSAKHVNEQENITVMVTVKGSPGHLQISITAPDRPDLTETQLYTLIVTGRLTFGGGTASSTTPTDRAASLVGGLVAAQLQKSLSKKLPFDVLTIEAGNGVGSARLEAGTYVTSELYVGYVGRLGADPALLQNRNAVHLEYELNAHWSFQGEYGDAKTGSADVMWTKRY